MEKQTFINEMTCHFNLREPKSQRPTNIYCIICIDGKQMKFPTGVKIYPDQWNQKKQEAFISFRLTELDNRNNHIVNDKISQIKQDFLNFKQYLCENPSELVSKIPLLKQYMYKNNMRKKKAILSAIETMRNLVYNSNTAESTKNQHTFNLNKFERFLKANNIEYRFENMNLKTITRYQKHLLDTGSTPKTIKNIIKGTIFPLLQKASKNNDIPFCWNNSNLDSFELVKDSSNKELAMNKKVALTEEQLQSIYNFEINEKSLQPLFKKKTSEDAIQRFQEVKDMFLLQAYIGQRISDVPKIYQNPIDQDHNTITIIQKKTNSKAVIPILPIARELIEKYKEKELKYYNEKSRNTPNKTIKLLLKLIGGFDEEITYQENGKTITEPLYELVHTHTARHTFITIMCRKGVPKDTVILATGHENTKMIDEVYTHLTQKDKAKKVSEAFDKAFNPVEELPSPSIMPDEIVQLINEGVAAAMKDAKEDFKKELAPVLEHINTNKATIKQDNVPMIVEMVVSLIKDKVPVSSIINMLDTTGILYSMSDVMTGMYIPIRPKK